MPVSSLKPKSRPPSKGEKTATRILLAATEIFAQQGYEKSSLKQIAQAAEAREPSIYQHFGSKEALYREVVNQTLNHYWSELEGWMGLTSPTELITLPDKIIDYFDDNPNAARLIQQEVSNHSGEPDKVAQYWFEEIFPRGEAMVEGISGNRTGDPRTKQIIICCMAAMNQITGFYTLGPYLEKLGYDCLSDEEAKAMQRKALKNSIKGMLFLEL